MKKLLIAATGSVAIVKLKKTIELLSKEFETKLIVSNYVLKNFPQVKELNPVIEKTLLNTYPEHIKLAKWADQIIVIPASANSIAKFYAGIADNPLLSTLIAARQPIIFVPAMNTYMYQALNKRNIIDNLSKQEHMFIGPVVGKLRENEVGMGRMKEPQEIFEAVNNFFNHSKKKIIISYGSTKVYIDPIRYISNDATGTMGLLLANQLRLSGHHVQAINVGNFSNEALLEKIKQSNFDIYIGAAAISDFYIEKKQAKISKTENLLLSFTQNIDVIEELKKSMPNKKFIAFKHDNNKQKALDKLQKNKFDKIIWNKIGAMGSHKISGAIIDNKGEVKFNNISKTELAKIIAKEI